MGRRQETRKQIQGPSEGQRPWPLWKEATGQSACTSAGQLAKEASIRPRSPWPPKPPWFWSAQVVLWEHWTPPETTTHPRRNGCSSSTRRWARLVGGKTVEKAPEAKGLGQLRPRVLRH